MAENPSTNSRTASRSGRQLALLSRIHELANDDSQFIITGHSPILMAYPDAWVHECSAAGIQRVHYQDTEHFQVMHDFVVNPERMLDILLDRTRDGRKGGHVLK